MIITEEKRLENKERFMELISSIKREGAGIDALINKLNKSDFFTAPASVMYHNNVAGGLCDHCLHVYEALYKLLAMRFELVTPDAVIEEDEEGKEILVQPDSYFVLSEDEQISLDSVKIVALLHDFSKMNFYEPSISNKKVYSENGSKSDAMGRFDWISEASWKTKASENRFLYGSHAMNAEFMTRSFIPLTIEESVAILHHMGNVESESNVDLTAIFNRYPLALYLHLADMLATYGDECIK